MTAYETFFDSIENGNVPAAIPIRSSDGRAHGLATQVLEYDRYKVAQEMVMSPDHKVRALAAIYAIYNTRQAVARSGSLIEPE